MTSFIKEMHMHIGEPAGIIRSDGCTIITAGCK